MQPGQKVPCVCESTYQDGLTRGRSYTVLEWDEEARQVRIESDRGRTRWFPDVCFGQEGEAVASLASFTIDDPLTPADDVSVEVTVELTNGERRWCWFGTPASLARSGTWIDGTEIPFHYDNRHVIIANELSEGLIATMLREMDAQGRLEACTLPLETDDGD